MKAAFITAADELTTLWTSRFFSDATLNACVTLNPDPSYADSASACMERKATRQEASKFKSTRQKLCKQAGKDWYLESNHHLFSMTPMIRQTFPDAKVVHIVQNGKEVVRSLLDQYLYITHEPLSPTHTPKTDPARPHWAKYNPLQKAAWHWKTVTEKALEQEPDMVLQHEAVFGGSHADLVGLFEALPELAYETKIAENSIRQSLLSAPPPFFPSYEDWPKDWKSQFKDIAGETMQLFGY